MPGSLGLGVSASFIESPLSGAPSWLPKAPSGDYAVFYANPVTGNCYAGGAVVSAVDAPTTLFYADPADDFTWNPATWVAGVGLVCTPEVGDCNPFIQQVYSAAMLAGFTAVLTGLIPSYNTVTDGQDLGMSVAILDDGTLSNVYDGNASQSGGTNTFAPLVQASINDPVGGETDAVNEVVNPSPGTSKFAFTWQSGNMACSFNGSAIAHVTPSAVGTPLTDVTFSIVQSGGETVTSVCTSITIYPPQPNADLPTLST